MNRRISFGNRREPMFHERFFRPVIEAEADISELQAILDRLPKRRGRGGMSACRQTPRLRCADCGADILVERIVDADGERLFGLCPCGLASVEHAAVPEFAAAPSRRGVNWRDGAETVASFSSV